MEFYRLFEGNQEPDKLRYQTRHVPNLFELPVLFYAGCIVAFVTGTVDTLLVGTAWLFVLTRYVHSYFHLTSNVVFYRAWSFVAGFVVIVFMWLVLSIRLISLGSARSPDVAIRRLTLMRPPVVKKVRFHPRTQLIAALIDC